MGAKCLLQVSTSATLKLVCFKWAAKSPRKHHRKQNICNWSQVSVEAKILPAYSYMSDEIRTSYPLNSKGKA